MHCPAQCPVQLPELFPAVAVHDSRVSRCCELLHRVVIPKIAAGLRVELRQGEGGRGHVLHPAAAAEAVRTPANQRERRRADIGADQIVRMGLG